MCTRRHILDQYPRSVWERLIDEWIYNELDRYILRRSLLDGITFDAITEEVNAPEYRMELCQVKRRFYAAAARLFDYAENARI